MRTAWFGLGVAAVIGWSGVVRAEGEKVRHIVPLDANWRFHVGEAAGAEAPGFGDAEWRALDVPHDWSIEGELTNQAAGVAGAYLPLGVGWYRQAFRLPTGAAGKKVFVEFDGVMQDARVWINGTDLGMRPYGYGSFQHDLTAHLTSAGANMLAVRADCSVQPIARWYAGGGIYRHVRLIVTDPVHLGRWATFITTPWVTEALASVHVATTVVNESAAARDVGLQIEIQDGRGVMVKTVDVPGQRIAAGASAAFAQEIEVARPALWDLEHPDLYKAIVRVRSGGTVLDDEVTTFGIRAMEFRPATGFWLNGKNVKLYGVCLHVDGGGVGCAVPNGVWERRLALLKAAGVNAVRTAHNAPDPEFLKLCDKMGLAVMHELFDSWTGRKVAGDYSRHFNAWFERDLTETLMRDRNHPSIVIYSAGNEIRDAEAVQMPILRRMLDIYHQVDPTRPVTQALFRPENNAYINGHAAMLDVVGTNYRPEALVRYQQEHPESKIIGTEDNYNAAELRTLRDAPALAGEFLWTGIDYLGEGRTPPAIAQGFGMIDRTNKPRLRYFERQSWWTTAPMVKIGRVAPGGGGSGGNDVGGGRVLDWTPDGAGGGGRQSVEVYSNCEEVELFLNGRSLGVQSRPASWLARTWSVDFEPGTLRAVARHKGVQAATDELKTAGDAVKIVLEADQKVVTRAWDDVVYVRARVTDAAGVTHPGRSDRIKFTLTGPGTLMAVDNADLNSHERFRGDERSAYQGECIAVIKGAGVGAITVKAEAAGLAAGDVRIEGK